jgi:hypothetical protein
MVLRTPETPDYGSLSPVLAAGAAAAKRARHAVDLALQCLELAEPSEEARNLVERGQRLKLEINHWLSLPPTPETRDEVMRGAVSMQVAALSLVRRAR